MTCKAIRDNDEMYCAKCKLRWDLNDPAPPKCGDAESGLGGFGITQHIEVTRGEFIDVYLKY